MKKNEVKHLSKSAPWYGYVNRIRALFGEDPAVKIMFNDDHGILNIYVDGEKKEKAIRRLLPESMHFGNYILEINIILANVKIKESSLVETYKDAFDGNPVVNKILTVPLQTNPMTYVVFRNEVVQYWDDNLGDIHGNQSMLMQDIAELVFDDTNGIYFCTDNL